MRLTHKPSQIGLAILLVISGFLLTFTLLSPNSSASTTFSSRDMAPVAILKVPGHSSRSIGKMSRQIKAFKPSLFLAIFKSRRSRRPSRLAIKSVPIKKPSIQRTACLILMANCNPPKPASRLSNSAKTVIRFILPLMVLAELQSLVVNPTHLHVQKHHQPGHMPTPTQRGFSTNVIPNS